MTEPKARTTLASVQKKRKTLEAAQKYAQKGAYDRALKEYAKLLIADPRDTNVRLKIGDLYLKKGNKQKAIEAYTQVALQFSKGGFDAKAVAIFKQILRVDSDCLEARVQLGDHFQRMGLASDALREFQLAVKYCQENDLKREAFDQLKKVALLDPGNIPNRLSLAALMLRQGLEEDALQEFGLLLKEVARHTGAELATRVAEATLDAFPDHKEALETLAELKISTGEPKQAIQLLTRALPNFVDDIEFREVLVTAYEAASNDEGVRAVYRDIAEIYKNRGDPEKARDILQRHVSEEPLLDTAETTSPSILLTEVDQDLTEDPDAINEACLDTRSGITLGEGAPLDAALGESLRSTKPIIHPAALLAEAKVSLEFGDAEEAERLARQVLDMEPSNAEVQQLLDRIAGPADDAPPEIELRPSEAALAAADDDDSLETLPDIELVLDDEEDRDDAFASIDPPDLPKPTPRVAKPSEAEIEIDLDEESGALGELRAPQPGRPSDSHVFGAEDWSAESARVSEDLEEAEFFIEQGMIPEAERLLRDVLSRSPNHPKAMLRLGELLSDRGEELTCDVQDELLSDTLVDKAESGDLPSIPEIDLGGRIPPPRKASAPQAAEPERHEGGEESLDDLLADAEEAIAAVQPTPEDDFDLAAELDDEPEEVVMGEKTGSGFDEVFAAFKKGIQDQVGEEDSETHYDLAIAYKEMGLLEDAVRELEIVQRCGARPAETLALMAACKLELDEPTVAAAHLSDALTIAGEGSESATSLRYDLGEALLAAGQRAEALEAFKKVASRQPAFRDVADRIAELS
ncbi:MAG: tetratricopeptide repeat protein [Myxococcota bacterium]